MRKTLVQRGEEVVAQTQRSLRNKDTDPINQSRSFVHHQEGCEIGLDAFLRLSSLLELILGICMSVWRKWNKC